MHQEISEIYAKFKSQTPTELSEEHFERMVFYFPAILVVLSDGKVDTQEWIYIKYLAKFIAETFTQKTEAEQQKLTEMYVEALSFLVQNATIWENKLLGALKEILSHSPEIKEDVHESLYLFAEASEESSDAEKRKIEQLCLILNLT
jgi:hypothetical protein